MWLRVVPLLALTSVWASAIESLDQWTARDSGVGDRLNAIAYGAGKWVTVGQNGVILTSSNGISWKQPDSNHSNELRAVTFGGAGLIAVGNRGSVLSSVEGEVWTAETAISTNDLYSVEWVDGRYFAGGVGGSLFVSSDGHNWESRDSGSLDTVQGIAFGNGVFVGVGRSMSHISSIFYSRDSLSWSNQLLNLNGLYDLVFARGLFVAANIRGRVTVSVDGMDWQIIYTEGGDYVFDVTYGYGMFVGVGGPFSGGSQKIVTSTDGRNWRSRKVILDPPRSPLLLGVAGGNGSFVAVGEKGLIVQSGPVFSLTVESSNAEKGVTCLFEGEAGRVYQVETSEEVTGPNWKSLLTFTNETERTRLSELPQGESPVGYYRAVLGGP